MVNYEKIRLSVAFMLAALLVPTSPYRTMALLAVRRAAASARHPLLQQTPRGAQRKAGVLRPPPSRDPGVLSRHWQKTKLKLPV